MVESVNNSVRAVLQQSASSTKPASGDRSVATQATSDGVDNPTSKQMSPSSRSHQLTWRP